jgi:hypothetical protein
VVDVRADVVGRRCPPVPLLAGAGAVALLALVAVAVLLIRSPSGGGPRSLPDVYGRSEADGTQMLVAAGHPTRSIPVCSTLPGGTVRQVLTDAGSDEGVVVDDSNGITPAGAALPGDAALVMKVSNGSSCGSTGTGGGGGATHRPTQPPSPTHAPISPPSAVPTRS